MITAPRPRSLATCALEGHARKGLAPKHQARPQGLPWGLAWCLLSPTSILPAFCGFLELTEEEPA